MVHFRNLADRPPNVGTLERLRANPTLVEELLMPMVVADSESGAFPIRAAAGYFRVAAAAGHAMLLYLT